MTATASRADELLRATECAFVLRSAGSGPVHPLALAMISGGGDAS